MSTYLEGCFAFFPKKNNFVLVKFLSRTINTGEPHRKRGKFHWWGVKTVNHL